MGTPLLKTKLYVPPVRAGSSTGHRTGLVQRARLIARLNEGLPCKLTLISAPAGFGKTTLLSEWVNAGVGSRAGREGAPPPTSYSLLPTPTFAWVSLDEGDNDPARFLAYVIAALQGTGVEQGTEGQRSTERSRQMLGKGLSDLLQSPQRLPIEEILTALINQIGTIAEDLVLILDDYHLIHAQRVHDALAFLLEHLPPQMHVVISTRADPPLSLARLRARGQLNELRQKDLRFTADECAEFLNQMMGLDLSVEEIATLASRTEGWIAALHMAAMSIQVHKHSGDMADFIQAFTGSDRYILDYLIEEVLHRQPAGIQTFLLHTAVLTRLSAPLCDAVLGQDVAAALATAGVSPERGQISPASLSDRGWDSGQAVLEALERANLFIVPLDNKRRWYRYHHLFVDLLRQRLQQGHPELVSILHGRASAWYEANGYTEEAIEHALAAGDVEWAADLIERVIEATVMRSELSTLRGWVEALPQDLVRTRPWLCVFDAWALLVTGCPLEAAQARLQDAARADDQGAFAGEIMVVRALIAAYQRETETSVELSSQALELLPEDSTFFRSFVAGYLGLNYLYSGDAPAARQAFEEAVRLGRKAGNVMNVVLALSHLADLSGIEGRLREARATYERAIEAAVNGQGKRLPVAGVPLCGLGRLVLLSNQLEDARRYLVQGTELVVKWGEAGAIGGYVGQAHLKQALGDTPGARAAIAAAEELADRFDAMRADDEYVAANKATLCVLQGDLDGAARWADGRDLDHEVHLDIPSVAGDGRSVPVNLVYEYLTIARLRVAQERYGEALAILRPLRRETKVAGWMIFVIRALVLEAVALDAQGHAHQALDALGRALSLAGPEGYSRVFLDQGVRMAQLLYQAVAQGMVRGPAADFAGQILAEFEVPGSRSALATARISGDNLEPGTLEPPTLIEPLSERELEVLALIAQGLTNREIAQRLHLSLSTIKVHAYNMYGKLDVHSRTQAVARARVLGLLPFT
jgi:LuxR family maltose regulon positive regulatory protein